MNRTAAPDQSTTTPAPRGTPLRRTRAGSVVLAVTASAAVSLVVRQVGVMVLDGEPMVRSGDGTTAVGVGAVVVAAALAALAGAVLMAALERWTSHPHGTWTVVALVVLLLSLTGPVGRSTTGGGLLVALHLVVAAVLAVVLLLPGRPLPGRPSGPR